jgi:membrane associated rhomboid family serine protease
MRRFLTSLPSGVRLTLLTLTICYVAAAVLDRLHFFNLYSLLALETFGFWRGHYWKVITFFLLPANLLDFVLNGIAFLTLAPRIEGSWSRRELWSLIGIAALGGGVFKLLLSSDSSVMFMGLAPVILGLLATWLKLFGNEQVSVMGIVTIPLRWMIFLVVVLSFILAVFQNGVRWRDFLAVLGGGITTWGYLCIRWRKNLGMANRTATSQRISRLEL